MADGYFLWRSFFPILLGSRSLTGVLPYAVRTFLPPAKAKKRQSADRNVKISSFIFITENALIAFNIVERDDIFVRYIVLKKDVISATVFGAIIQYHILSFVRCPPTIFFCFKGKQKKDLRLSRRSQSSNYLLSTIALHQKLLYKLFHTQTFTYFSCLYSLIQIHIMKIYPTMPFSLIFAHL